MKIPTLRLFVSLTCLTLLLAGCGSMPCHKLEGKSLAIYEDHTIPANTGISTGVYTEVDGFRYLNITVEFEQNASTESPVSLGIVFAHDTNGKWGSRRYFTFEENFNPPADPQMITLSGKGSWHGLQQQKSSYTARLPVMGPYVQVFPFNHHDADRDLSVVLYLTR
ncbi:MAG: hypothetical protein QNJ78_09785 [Gammaproteobacteria bacterium]|nr:hypothetical protein [Gammaproteobacteria bacterium]